MVDFAGLKSAMKSIFNAANTTTGAAYDLSTGLVPRVKKVLSIHPQRLPIQVSFYPYVSLFVDSKDIEAASIAINQKNAKRSHVIHVKVVGAVRNSKVTDKTADMADDECEKLMENIEEILRRNPTLNGQCLWQMPDTCTYHNKAIDEESALRVGILNLNVKLLE